MPEDKPFHSLHDKRVLVTGAGGFIGTYLCRSLVEAGASVTGLDLKAVARFPGTAFIQRDVFDLDAGAVADLAPEIVFHLSAIVGVTAAAASPADTRRAIAGTTEHMLSLARTAGSPEFAYVSSSEVYGESPQIPIVERTPLAPLSPYGRAKMEGEELVARYARETGARTTIIRPFNVYGPGQRTDFVVARFVAQAMRGAAITVAGDGTQMRTFTYIDDFVRGVAAAVDRPDTQSGVYNITGYEATSIGTLAALVADVTGRGEVRLGIGLEDLGRPDRLEVKHRIAALSGACRELGFVPRTSLREGIAQVARASATD